MHISVYAAAGVFPIPYAHHAVIRKVPVCCVDLVTRVGLIDLATRFDLIDLVTRVGLIDLLLVIHKSRKNGITYLIYVFR